MVATQLITCIVSFSGTDAKRRSTIPCCSIMMQILMAQALKELSFFEVIISEEA